MVRSVTDDALGHTTMSDKKLKLDRGSELYWEPPGIHTMQFMLDLPIT